MKIAVTSGESTERMANSPVEFSNQGKSDRNCGNNQKNFTDYGFRQESSDLQIEHAFEGKHPHLVDVIGHLVFLNCGYYVQTGG